MTTWFRVMQTTQGNYCSTYVGVTALWGLAMNCVTGSSTPRTSFFSALTAYRFIHVHKERLAFGTLISSVMLKNAHMEGVPWEAADEEELPA